MKLTKNLAILLLGAGMALTAAEIVVRVGPPRSVWQNRGPRPNRDSIWIPGYQNWDGQRHVWVVGRWDRPPQPRGRWEAHHWVRRNGGWVLIEGRWR